MQPTRASNPDIVRDATMKTGSSPKARQSSVTETDGLPLYIAAALVTILCVWVLGDLSHADLRYPIAPLDHDALFAQAIEFKGMADNPWYLDNQWLGAPFGLNLRDASSPDFFLLATIKLLTLVTKNHVLIRNVLAIASYPLVTLTSLYVMRRLGIRSTIALVASLLYSFISYHHARLGLHLFLAIGYFTVPIAALWAIGLFENEPLFVVAGGGNHKWRLVSNRQTWVACVWCVVMGMTGIVYYTFFSCYLIGVAAVLAAIHHRSIVPLWRATCLGSLMCASMMLGMLPLLTHHWAHGNANALIRNAEAAEVYGLKIIQLLIPGTGHRLPALQGLSDYYNRVAPLVNENHMAYLGAIGGLGFLYLIFILLRGEQCDSRLRSLSVFNIAAVLLGTLGGFSSLIAFTVSYEIRSYNRICVYIAFFSLLALAIVAERLAARRVKTRKHQVAMGAALTGLLLIGLYDQYTSNVNYDDLKRDYIEQGRFVAQIEAALPPGSSIFQYPRFPFPEHDPIEKLTDYAEFMPYLHSKKLRWSYGTMKRRRGDAWQANIFSMPPIQAIDALVQAGFAGIYVARDGYADHGKDLEASLRSLLGDPSVVSADNTAAFYSIVDRATQLRSRLGEAEFERRKQEALSPMHLGWLNGCDAPNSYDRGQRTLCGAKGHFVVDNPSTITSRVVLEARLSVFDKSNTVRLRSDVLNRDLKVGTGTSVLSESFDVPPGEHIFTVTTDGRSESDGNYHDYHVAIDDAHLTTIVRSVPVVNAN